MALPYALLCAACLAALVDGVALLHPARASMPAPAGAPASASFTLPAGFEGLWEGRPAFSPLGPWAGNLTFGVSRAANGDYLLQNGLPFGLPSGWQRFYVEVRGARE